MPTAENKAKRPKLKTVYADVDDEVYTALVLYVEDRGSSMRAEVEMAIRRHLNSPPPKPEPPPVVPLPPLPNGAPKRKKEKS